MHCTFKDESFQDKSGFFFSVQDCFLKQSMIRITNKCSSNGLSVNMFIFGCTRVVASRLDI